MIRTIIQKGTGGAPGTALVVIGPDYGNPPEHEVGTRALLESIDVSATEVIASSVTLVSDIFYMPADLIVGSSATLVGDLVYAPAALNINSAALLAELALTYSATIAVSTAGALDISGYTATIATQLATDLAVDYAALTVGSKVAGDLEVDYTALSVASKVDFSLAVEGTAAVENNVSGNVLSAPFFRSVSTLTSAAAGVSIVVTKPAGTTQGDILVAHVGQGGSAGDITFTAPAGWTLIVHTNSAGTLRASQSSFWLLAGAAEGATYTFTASASCSYMATMIALIGADETAPIDVFAGAAGNAADPIAPTITTASINCFMSASFSAAAAAAESTAPPATYTERSDLNAQVAALVVASSSCATRVQAATGASGAQTFNSTALLARQYVAHHVAVKPALLTIA